MAKMEADQQIIVNEPVHQQLAKICRAEIASGKLRPEDRFPSERTLAAKYGVHRSTANKVISQLVAEGVLTLKPGIGTFVAPIRGLHTSLRQMESFTDAALSAGMVPKTDVLCFRKEAAHELPQHVRESLGLKGRASAVYFERLRVANGEPVILEYRWVRSDLVPGLTAARLTGSFYHYLEEQYKIFLTGERHTVHAKNLDKHEAQKFKLPVGSAVLVVEGSGFTQAEDPVWYQILYYRGDRYELQNEVHVLGRPSTFAVQLRA
jgi:GntR family transcriptional regulator